MARIGWAGDGSKAFGAGPLITNKKVFVKFDCQRGWFSCCATLGSAASCWECPPCYLIWAAQAAASLEVGQVGEATLVVLCAVAHHFNLSC